MTPNPDLGDFAIPCFKIAKTLGQNPGQVAAGFAPKLQEEVRSGKTPFREVRAVGPYLNFFVDAHKLFSELQLIIDRDPKKFGGSSVGQGKTLIVEYSSPNIAKEMALHHLRSTAIGNALANLGELHGFKTVRINYLGDWGTSHGKNILGIQRFGNEKDLIEKGLPYLLDIYVRFNAEEKTNPKLSEEAKEAFSKLEKGDPEYRRLWKLFRDISVAEYKKLYDRLGVSFDVYDGESLYEKKLEASVTEITEKVGTRISDGALVADLPGHSIPILLKKDDGSSLYITRDLAAMEDRWARYSFDHMWYAVDVRQGLHFKQLFDMIKALGKPYAGRGEHIPFGMLMFGSKVMKTREGNIVFLTDVLDEAKERALKVISEKNPDLTHADDVAEMIGVGAVIFSDLSQHRARDVKFDWDSALSFEGDTAPFIQYAHARCCSLLKKGKAHLATLAPTDDGKEAEIFEIEAVRRLVRQNAFFVTFSERALNDRDPSQIATATLNIAKALGHFYHEVRLVSETSPSRLKALLALADQTRVVIEQGLRLLGIRAPQEM